MKIISSNFVRRLYAFEIHKHDGRVRSKKLSSERRGRRDSERAIQFSCSCTPWQKASLATTQWKNELNELFIHSQDSRLKSQSFEAHQSPCVVNHVCYSIFITLKIASLRLSNINMNNRKKALTFFMLAPLLDSFRICRRGTNMIASFFY